MAALDLVIPISLAILAIGALAGVSMGVYSAARSLFKSTSGRKS